MQFSFKYKTEQRCFGENESVEDKVIFSLSFETDGKSGGLSKEVRGKI